MEIKIIDNFLSTTEFDRLSKILLSYDFPWYYSDSIDHPKDGNFQYFHRFYDNYDGYSDFYHIIEPTLNRIGGFKLHRAKANTTAARKFLKRKQSFHIDMENVTTAILYINSNNGGTKFKKGPFIRSVENRMVIFNSNIEHCGVFCTDKKRRVVINFNYV